MMSAYLPSLSPSAVKPGEKFLIVNEFKNRIVQSECSEDRAKRGAAILQAHDDEHGHSSRYIVVSV